MNKPIFSLALTIWIATAVLGQAATGWVVRSGLTEAQMPAEVTKWTGAPYNLQPVCVSGYEIAGVARFSELFVQPTDNVAVLSSFALTEAAMSLTNASRQTNGYRLIWLNGFGLGTEARYNAIWKKTNGATQQIRLGQTLAQHQADDNTFRSQGYSFGGVSSYTVNGSPLHAAWWNDTNGFSVVTDVVYSQTAAQYQAAFNAHPASAGWRLTSVSGYTVGGAERFTAIFRQSSGPPWFALNGLGSGNFDASNDNAHYTGFRPAFLQTYPISGAPRANAVWQYDHGLTPDRTGAISSAVLDYMNTYAKPGLSLAITRRGRLVYASGFGYADTSTGDLVGPLNRFRIASVSKPFTAVAVLHALERFPGTLNSFVFGTGALLGTDFGTPPYYAAVGAIRVRNLLNMTSSWVNDGLLWYHDMPSWGSDNLPAIDYQVDSAATVGMPGDYYQYANVNFVTAARIIEKLSGQTFENYVKNEILAPCGVTDMAVGNRLQVDRQAREVTYYGGNETPPPYMIDPRRMDGSTAWIAKPMDLLLFARRMDNDATHTDILLGASMADMRTPSGAPVYNDPGHYADNYGLGWASSGSPITSWSHNGSMAGTTADLVTRTDGISWAYASNTRAGGDDYSSNFFNLINGLIDNIEAANAWPLDGYDLYSHVNTAYDPWRDQYFTALERSEPGLQATVWGFSADPDQDDVGNGAEAYLGRNPLAGERAPFTLIKSGSNMTVRWLRSTTDRQVVPIVETSSNLTTWLQPIGVTIQPRTDLIAPVGYRYEEIVVAVTPSRRHYRLRFEPL